MKLKFSRFIEAAWEELGAGSQVPVSFSSREFFCIFRDKACFITFLFSSRVFIFYNNGCLNLVINFSFFITLAVSYVC